MVVRLSETGTHQTIMGVWATLRSATRLCGAGMEVAAAWTPRQQAERLSRGRQSGASAAAPRAR